MLSLFKSESIVLFLTLPLIVKDKAKLVISDQFYMHSRKRIILLKAVINSSTLTRRSIA